MIPIELSKPSSRTITMIEEYNELTGKAGLDLVKEDRENARVKEEAIKQQMVRKYNKQVTSQEFEERDLVLKKVELQRKPQGERKLASNWERPYRVIRNKIVELKGRELQGLGMCPPSEDILVEVEILKLL